jgi:PAS domain S-box-containing protein
VNFGRTLFPQVMDFVPWTSFARLVAKYDGDLRVRKFRCTEQFRAMAFAQLTFRESLRDIESCLGAQPSKRYGMGFRSPVAESTLADANELREWRMWHDLASEARFRVTFENAPVGIGNLAPGSRWLKVNEAMCRFLGYTADELTTKSFQDTTLDQMCRGKLNRYDADKRYLRKDGAIVWGGLTASCVRKSDGSIDYIVTVVDITARKQAEEELCKSEERFRSSVLHSPLPVLMYDDREQILAVSQSWLDESGFEGGVVPNRGLDNSSLRGTLW